MFKRQEIRDFSPMSLKLLNDNIRNLWLKVFGNIEVGDVTSDFGSKIDISKNGSVKTVRDDITGLDGRITNAETSITQTAQELILKADKSVVDSLSNTVSEHTAELQIHAEQIASKVSNDEFASKIEQNADSVKIAVGQIGGTNLVKNGSFDFDINGWVKTNSSVILRIETTYAYDSVSGYVCPQIPEGGIYQDFPTVVGQKYTVQFVAQQDQTTPGLVQIGIDGIHMEQLNSSAGYKKIVFTFTATSTTHRFLVYNQVYVGVLIDQIKIEEGENATAWSPHPSELKSGCFTVTDDYARFTASDGSYTEFVPSSTGLKWHKGGTSRDYHYLMYSGSATMNSNSTSLTITLPEEFRNKDFKVVLAIRQIDAYYDNVINRIQLYVSNIDKANGNFTVYGKITTKNVGFSSQGGYLVDYSGYPTGTYNNYLYGYVWTETIRSFDFDYVAIA